MYHTIKGLHNLWYHYGCIYGVIIVSYEYISVIKRGPVHMINEMIAECSDYDFKEILEVKRPQSWLKTVSAFANGTGGTLFFGVDDTGAVVGLDDIKSHIGKITDMIQAKIEPNPVFHIIPCKENNLTFLKVDILSGQFTPYYYYSDGNRIAYYRLGDESIQAPSYILNELILRGSGQTYDSVLTQELSSDYSFSYLKSKYLNTVNLRFNSEDFVSFGLSDGKNLSRAGLLLADTNRVRQSRIFCTRWNGVDKLSEETVINDAEISGCLLIQLDRAIDFFKANTNIKWHKERGETVYNPDYDEGAVKEALVNAIIHRDYNVLGAEVVLNIYDDRLEITSPGGMCSGKEIPSVVDKVMESKRRNPIIADLFHRLHLMNRRGSGLANITNRTNKLFDDGNNHVFYRSDNEFFVVKIENANYSVNVETINDRNETLNRNEAAVLKLIKKNSFITQNEMANALSLSRSTVIRITNKLTRNGIIQRVGANKNGYWKVIRMYL